jgi:high-affinity Fe2+/Pb2+ permease
MLLPRQFSLAYLLTLITASAMAIGLVRYLLVSGNGGRFLTWVGLALTIFIAGVMVTMGGWSLFHAVRQLRFWPKVQARIVRYWIKRSDSSPNGQRFYHPVVQFEATDGRRITTISFLGLVATSLAQR